MTPPTVLDAHVHFWNPARLRYPWLTAVPALNRRWEPADFAAASASVPLAGLVFVECGRDPAQNVDEAAWVTELAAADRRIRAIVAHASVERGAAVRDELEALARFPLVRGVRRLLQDEADPAFCLRPAFVSGVRALGEFGFSFDVCVYHRQLPAVIELVERCPDVQFILDHAGKPAIRERRLDPWREQLRVLAGFPRVRCKLSGLATEADPDHWQPADLQPYVDHVLECFGFDRVLFGGDWPVATLATSYRRWFDVVAGAAAHGSDAQRHQLFHLNAQSAYRLQAAGLAPPRPSPEDRSPTQP